MKENPDFSDSGLSFPESTVAEGTDSCMGVCETTCYLTCSGPGCWAPCGGPSCTMSTTACVIVGPC